MGHRMANPALSAAPSGLRPQLLRRRAICAAISDECARDKTPTPMRGFFVDATRALLTLSVVLVRVY